MTAPWVQTASGRAFDLLSPDPRDVDFRVDVAEALARIPRYAGHVRSGPYSVAQHCVLGADWLWRKHSRRDLAAWFLLHDAHEAYVGDITTPVVAALETERGGVIHALVLLKHRVDTAIRDAAGVPRPGLADQETIHQTDVALMNAERRWLHHPAPRSWGAHIDAVPPLPLIPDHFKPWPWTDAADRWLDAFDRYVKPLAHQSKRSA